jgi:hypothetical protein
MLGKAMLFKHYYYHVKERAKGSANDIADLTLARDMLRSVIQSGTYSLVKPQEPRTRNDLSTRCLSNSAYVDLPAGNNLYQSKNNQESVWEVQYSNERIQSGMAAGMAVVGSAECSLFQSAWFKLQEP